MAKTQRARERAPKATKKDAPAPTNQDLGEPTNQDLGKPTNQDVEEPTNQDVEEPTNQDWKKPTNEDGIVWTAQKIRLRDLTPWERNPRSISVEAGRRLRESFKEFGQVETIAIGPTGEVYNGHQRLKELIHEFGGDFEVDARVSSRVLTEKEREKLTIYLHKGAAGDWDYEMLAGQFDLGELHDWGFGDTDLELLGDFIGKDESDSGSSIDIDADNDGPEIDRAEELRESWGVERGQLWRLGDHRLLCGDCTNQEDLARVLMNDTVDACVTDPPYGIGLGYDGYEDSRENLRALINAFLPPLRKLGCPIALTGGTSNMWLYPEPTWVMTWVHPAASGRGPWGFNGNNPILVYGKDPYLKERLGARLDSLVLDAGREGVEGHPVPKPLKVWLWLVERVTTRKGTVVVDSFSGAGTTIMACEHLGRRCRAIEQSPGYVALTLQRYADATDRFPRLVA